MIIYYDVYSAKGVERVKTETHYKPTWQIEQELIKKYKTINNIK